MEAFVPFTGQRAGLIDDISPAAEIVADLVREAEGALRTAFPSYLDGLASLSPWRRRPSGGWHVALQDGVV